MFKPVFIILLLVLQCIVIAEPVEIILQNGHEQYAECADAYFINSDPAKKTAASKSLEVRCDGT